jgi:hypothetical protein
MKCKILECIDSKDCVILDIIGEKKIPISKDKCSFFKTEKKKVKEIPKKEKRTKKC